ncbi:MAG: hypothetical protein WCO13_14375 [Bacteroidota bacterium]
MKAETIAIIEKYNIKIYNHYISNWIEICLPEYDFSSLKGIVNNTFFFPDLNYKNNIQDLLKEYSLENYYELFEYLGFHIYSFYTKDALEIDENIIKIYKFKTDLPKFIQIFKEFKTKSVDDLQITIRYNSEKGLVKESISPTFLFYEEFLKFIQNYDEKKSFLNYKSDEYPVLDQTFFYDELNVEHKEIIKRYNKKGRPNKNYFIGEILNLLQKFLQNETLLKSEAKIISSKQALFIYKYLDLNLLIDKKDKIGDIDEDKKAYILTILNNYRNNKHL